MTYHQKSSEYVTHTYLFAALEFAMLEKTKKSCTCAEFEPSFLTYRRILSRNCPNCLSKMIWGSYTSLGTNISPTSRHFWWCSFPDRWDMLVRFFGRVVVLTENNTNLGSLCCNQGDLGILEEECLKSGATKEDFSRALGSDFAVLKCLGEHISTQIWHLKCSRWRKLAQVRILSRWHHIFISISIEFQ